MSFRGKFENLSSPPPKSSNQTLAKNLASVKGAEADLFLFLSKMQVDNNQQWLQPRCYHPNPARICSKCLRCLGLANRKLAKLLGSGLMDQKCLKPTEEVCAIDDWMYISQTVIQYIHQKYEGCSKCSPTSIPYPPEIRLDTNTWRIHGR